MSDTFCMEGRGVLKVISASDLGDMLLIQQMLIVWKQVRNVSRYRRLIKRSVSALLTAINMEKRQETMKSDKPKNMIQNN